MLKFRPFAAAELDTEKTRTLRTPSTSTPNSTCWPGVNPFHAPLGRRVTVVALSVSRSMPTTFARTASAVQSGWSFSR